MKKFNNLKSTKKAFTLVELLVVIAIIGILFVVLVSKVDFATDKAKATGVQVTFRSYQMAFEHAAKGSSGFNINGWNTGDISDDSLWQGKQVSGQADGVTYTYTNKDKDAGDGVRNTYDRGDANLNGKEDAGEVFCGRKFPVETWTDVYTLTNPADPTSLDGYRRLERAINSNLDPSLHITIGDPDANGVALITMANAMVDPWGTEYKGYYISNAHNDDMDRGAIVLYSAGPNGVFGCEQIIANGVVDITIPGNNVAGQDDYALVVCCSLANDFVEVKTFTAGFSNNQGYQSAGVQGSSGNAGGNGGNEPNVNEPIPTIAGATFTDGVTLAWEELQLPENGTKYGYSATGITNTSIGYGAFKNCSSLVSVGIPDSVTSIGGYVFSGCSSLTSVVIPDSVTSISGGMFKDCSSLTGVVIPDNTTSIGTNVFDGCSSLASVVIPNSVTEIPMYAFKACTSLTNVTIGNSVTSIGYGAFYLCTGLTSIVIPNSVTNIDDWAVKDCYGLTSVVIGNGVIGIGDYAFSGCSRLTNITIGNSVKYFGEYAFNGCRSLTTIAIPNSVTSIGKSAFYGCSSLTSVVIPDSVTYIGDGAFYNCTGLASVVISNSVTEICKNVFYNCTGLTSIVIPDSVAYIRQAAFRDCDSLTNVVIPDGVKIIDNNAFYSCDKLTSIIIPDSVTTIGEYAFQSCSSLTIYCQAESQPAGWNSNWNRSDRPVVWGYSSGQ